MQLNLSLPTVVQNLNELSEDGLICEAGQQTKTGGRRAKTYTSVNDFRTAIGLDVTPHEVAAVAVDLCGHILARKRLKVPFVRTADYYRQLGRRLPAAGAAVLRAGAGRRRVRRRDARYL